MTDLDAGSAAETPQRAPDAVWGRLRRALTAGGVVGGAVTGGVLAVIVGLRLLTDYLGLVPTVAILAFGIGITVAVAVIDWLMED